MTNLRPFQLDMKRRVYEAWQEPNVFAVMPCMPTGSGKTVLFSSIVGEYQSPSCIIAHRMELVAQASLALNRDYVPHSILAPRNVRQQIIALHHSTHGYSTFAYRSETKVAGIDTLIRHDPTDRWFSQVGLVVIDEGHHVVDNKWLKGLQLFPNARALLPTATAVRADGKGLGRHADGVVDRLLMGPSARDLINQGFLTDYRILCPASDIDFSEVSIGSTGDYSMPQLRAVTHKSNKIVGDVVRHYLKHAQGKLGVSFVVDLESALELTNAYNAAGVPAKIISGKTPIAERGQIMRQFRDRTLLQLVACETLGEGVDVPAIEVVSMVRKTASFGLFAQQFGRALRIMVSDEDNSNWANFSDEERRARIASSVKPKALILDQVGQLYLFCRARVASVVPQPQYYDLDRREGGKRGRADTIPLRACTECARPYERFRVECPYCGNTPIPAGRSSPDQVEVDLIELEAVVLASLRSEINRIVGEAPAIYEGSALGGHIATQHTKRQEAQAILRKSMQLWGGWKEAGGMSTREAQKRFFFEFGVDVMTAQTLSTGDAYKLNGRIQEQLAANGVYAA